MENKELLEKVVKDRLEASLSDELDSEEKKNAFREAMDAIDRQNEMERIVTGKKEQNYNRYIRYGVEIGLPLCLFGLGVLVDRKNMKDLCHFEKDYTFTTTAGRRWASNLFRSRK